MKLLHIDSSILGENSVSRRLSAAIVARLTEEHPAAVITRRDLAADPIPHLTGAELAAASAPNDVAGPTRAALAVGAAALEEFLAADVVVIGAPMYNFGVPSTLKAWIDRLAVAGKTFVYTEQGAKGLAGGKRVIIASARGGLYAPGTPLAANDFEEPYLQTVFGFFGVTAIEIVRAEGVNLGSEPRLKAIDDGLAKAAALAA